MNSWRNHNYIFILVLIIFGCTEDQEITKIDAQKPIDLPFYCDIENAIQILNAANQESNLISDFSSIENYMQFDFFDGTIVKICHKIIVNYQKNDTDWTLKLTFVNDSSITLMCQGAGEVLFNANPSGYNPLCGELLLSSSIPTTKTVTLLGKNGNSSDIQFFADSMEILSVIPIFGLYSDYENNLVIEFANSEGIIIITDTLQITTDPIPEDFIPNTIINENNAIEMQPGFTLVSSFHHSPNIPYMIDNYGHVRWYLNTSEHPDFSSLFYDVGIEQLQNGNLYFGNLSTNKYFEIDFFGNIINAWTFPDGYGLHHNIQEKPDGNFLVTANKFGDFHLNGAFCKEDHILELDRVTGNINHSWDLKYFLDENRNALVGIYPYDPVDWFHANAVIYDESDNSIIVSGRHQCVVKIGYDDQLKWILGNHTGWGQNRNGEETSSYVLTALDQNGNVLSDDIQYGWLNHEDFEWNWYQHAVMLMPNGNLMLFDNGDFRNFNFTENGNYSRAVEFEINTSNRTVKQIWTYGKEREKECFSRFVSDVDYDMESNNVIFAPGMSIENNGIPSGGRIVELDYTTKQVYFDAVIESNGFTFHRVERINLIK